MNIEIRERRAERWNNKKGSKNLFYYFMQIAPFYHAVFALFISLSFAISPIPSTALGPGTVAGQFLKTDISPRAIGMAGSFVSVADDIYSVVYNPAGMGRLYLPEASAMYMSGFSDSKIQFVAIGAPLPINGLSDVGRPGLAFSALFENEGDFTYRGISSVDGSISTKKMDAGKNTLLSLSYGEKVFSGEVNIEGYSASIEQFAGISVKYLNSKLLDEYSASSLLFDAGYLVTENNLGLTLGASLLNIGGKLTYLNKKEPVPIILRTGISYFKPTISDQSILISFEGDFYTNEKLKSLKLGLEYHFQKIFDLRLGYKTAEDNGGLSAGLGVIHKGFLLDFGMSVSNEVFNTSQVSFTYKFYGFRGFKPAKKRSYIDYMPPAKIKKKKAPAKDKKKDKPKDSDFFWIY